MSVQAHPTTWAQFRAVAARGHVLRQQHTEACARLWAGTVASQFSDYDLTLLRAQGYLSPDDEAWLRRVRQHAQ